MEPIGAYIMHGDLLEFAADCIVHQVNCVSIKAHGLSLDIAHRFPYADVYAKRATHKPRTRGALGSVVFMRPRTSTLVTTIPQPVVACLMAQVCPAKPGDYAATYGVPADQDTTETRFAAFRDCLGVLSVEVRARQWSSVAFPFQIGCGLAGSMDNWHLYENAIHDFANSVQPTAQVFILKKHGK